MEASACGVEVVVPCPALDPAVELLQSLGFRIETVIPADDPSIIVLARAGTRLRLVRDANAATTTLRIAADRAGELVVPGLRVELVVEPALVVPPLVAARVVTTDRTWHTGRAGMQYRDLIPDRQGGRFIASHIRITDGGPVPDYVHYHVVRAQLIYCRAGSVRVVYEDQGEPIVVQPGDCVLQPPGIRHRVLEASAGLEVVEVSSPAIHATHADHDLGLPTASRDRRFDGQRFVWHRAATARWTDEPGWRVRDLGLAEASVGLVRARVLRATSREPHDWSHAGELRLGLVLRGELDLDGQRLIAEDAFVVPPREPATLVASADVELLDVTC